MNNKNFWRRARKIVKLCAPVLVLLRMGDSPAPSMGKVYYHCFQLLEHIRNSSLPGSLEEGLKKQVFELAEKRWARKVAARARTAATAPLGSVFTFCAVRLCTQVELAAQPPAYSWLLAGPRVPQALAELVDGCRGGPPPLNATHCCLGLIF